MLFDQIFTYFTVDHSELIIINDSVSHNGMYRTVRAAKNKLKKRKGTLSKLLSGLFLLRGGTPIQLSFFGHNDVPLRGGGYHPIPLRKKSVKKQLFLAKIRLF